MNKLLSLSADPYDNRVLRVGLKHPVSTQDRSTIRAALEPWNVPADRNALFERLVKQLKSTAKWCPTCRGLGTHVEWSKESRPTAAIVDCELCAPTRARLAEVTS